jgi:myo-inositol catabolism protein IolC
MSLYILPFDHRGSFMRMINANKNPTAKDILKAKGYKRIIYDAFLFALENVKTITKKNSGILVDEWLGKEILIDANERTIITATTMEMSGQKEFHFDQKDWKKQLQRLKPTYAKVLVRYNPEGDKKSNKRQTKRLVILSKYLEKKKTKLLFELLVPATTAQLKKVNSKKNYDQKIRPQLMVKAIKELEKAGVKPDLWKLEGLYQTKLMQQVADEIGNSKIIVLGRGESERKARLWVRKAAKVKKVVGFAVGRTIFQKPLEKYDQGKYSRQKTVKQIANNYIKFVKVFVKSKG